jgi:primosomal protein N' (replication factor Y)
MTYASVLLEVSVQKTLDYSIPTELSSQVEKGVLVEVPLRGKLRRAFVVEKKDTTSIASTLPVANIVSSGPVLTHDLFELALWIAKYYVCPLGKVIKTMLPPGVRKNTQQKEQYTVFRNKTRDELQSICVELRSKAPQQAHVLETLLLVEGSILLSDLLEKSNAPASSVKALHEKGYIRLSLQPKSPVLECEYFQSKPKELRAEQKEAFEKIISSMQSSRFDVHLIHGITGSGKTEVYLQAIDHALKQQKGVIILVPEISLTEQTIERLRSRFSEKIAVLHYRLSDGEKSHMWQQILHGACPIVIGARSAIFSPLPNLGLIIVDEEHDQSYKQSDDAPCYQARDVAVFRAKMLNIPIVLGSATPSLESYLNAKKGKYILSTLSSRGSASLPKVTIVNMRHEYEKNKRYTPFSNLLLSKIEDRKKQGQQTILFLNRRGFHTLALCQSCLKPILCPHCDMKLAFHKSIRGLLCHLCGEKFPEPKSCPTCHAHGVVKFSGIGTEKIESMIRGIFPDLRTVRIDADSSRHKGSLETLLQEFRSGKADLLIGTQMIAKGLHFPDVTLVGVLQADASLNIPDFRAQEQVFQLITQVSGRAGRGEYPGEVVIQTEVPEHSTIVLGSKQDYIGFYNEEIELRKSFQFPPFSQIVKFSFTGKDEAHVFATAQQYFSKLTTYLPAGFHSHPVVPAGHAKVKDFFRAIFLIRGPAVMPIASAIEQTEKTFKLPSTVFRSIDVNPSSTC